MVSLLSGNAIDRMVYESKLKNSTHLSTIELENEFRVSVGCSLAFLVGVCDLVMGFTGLGVIASLFSDTFISSYTCGYALQICVTQLKDLFGIKNAFKYEGPLKLPKVCS